MWHEQSVDGGLLRFDRRTATNVLVRGPDLASSVRSAPRALQVGLVSSCNLSCAFCYRDAKAPSRLTAPFLVELLTAAADWGVLEVAFGGGEPLLFDGFVAMLEELHARTPLGLAFTTNGLLLDDATIQRVRGLVTEVRLSATGENRYRQTLRRLQALPVGVNWLVTPRNVGLVEPYVADFVTSGASSVLLLGYKGGDPELHLSGRDFDKLRGAVGRLRGVPLRLDACWYPKLHDLPHLFDRGDCGAGDELLVITPDQAVQACSFSGTRVPFSGIDDLKRIYADLRQARPRAEIGGCTRDEFLPIPATPPQRTTAWVWTAASSNNSGDWTIVAHFCDEAAAEKAARALRELSRAHEAFLASPDGQKWVEDHDYDGSYPTPPLSEFGRAHGFDWSQDDEGLWWEEDGCGAPVLTAGAVGEAVVVYHPYCMGLPEEPFRQFFENVGAKQFGHWQYDRPRVVASASGRNTNAEAELSHYLSLVQAADYPSQVKAPPWGKECEDARVWSDEDRSALLGAAENKLLTKERGIELVLSFENTFAGALALEAWLRAAGYQDVVVKVDPGPTHLEQQDQAREEAITGLFGDVRPLVDKLRGADAPTVVKWLFGFGRISAEFEAALARMSREELVRYSLAEATDYWGRGLDVTLICVAILEVAGPSEPAAELARRLWDHLNATESRARGLGLQALAHALPRDEAFELAEAWYRQGGDDAPARLQAFRSLKNPRTNKLIEEWWLDQTPPPPVQELWGALAFASQAPWSTLAKWLGLGRPLSLVALDALGNYAKDGTPAGFQRPPEAEIRDALRAYLERDSAPRARNAAARVLGSIGNVARDEGRG